MEHCHFYNKYILSICYKKNKATLRMHNMDSCPNHEHHLVFYDSRICCTDCGDTDDDCEHGWHMLCPEYGPLCYSCYTKHIHRSNACDNCIEWVCETHQTYYHCPTCATDPRQILCISCYQGGHSCFNCKLNSWKASQPSTS